MKSKQSCVGYINASNGSCGKVRMHSSGMCTARLLTVSQHARAGGIIPACTLQGRGCLPRGMSAWRGGGVCTGGGVCKGSCLPREGVSAQGRQTPPGPEADSPCGQTDTCENITFANFVCWR